MGSQLLLEVGPVTVRRIGDNSGLTGDAADAALSGIDDPVVLQDEQPVAVADLWRRVIGSALGPGAAADAILIVHPSWWPKARVGRIVSAAATAGFDSVAATSRCAFLAGRFAGVIVEADADWVTIGDRTGATVLARRDARGIAAALSRCGGEVFLDDPRDGAVDLSKILARNGIRPTPIGLDSPAGPAAVEPEEAPASRRVRRVGFLAVAVSSVVAVGVALGYRHEPVGAAVQVDEAASLVEGRVAVRIPARWDVDRVTTGPGSRRVQVRSPSDPDTALHITQSYVPESTLADAAAVLGRAVAAQPPGVFADLRAATVAGRDAVTYREIRPGRVIRWSVVLDGATRISIGCQSAAGREGAVEGACAQAVGSAREYGTETAR